MNRLLAVSFAATLIAASGAPAQPKPAAQPATATANKPKPAAQAAKPKDAAPSAKAEGPSKEMEDAAKAGANHRLLEWFEGEWDAVIACPGHDKPDTGTMTCKMVYGGRFLAMDQGGRSQGKFFRGGGMWGYNNLEKRFEQTWADSESTGIIFLTGKASADGKSIAMIGEAADPNTGKKSFMKNVMTITGKNSWKSEFFSYENNRESKSMEIVFSRAKADSQDAPAAKEPPAEQPADSPSDKPKK